MADILKMTTPLVNRAQLPEHRPGQQPTSDVQFSLAELTKVIKTNDGKESLLQQHNTLVGKESTNILMDMMKDPSATMMFIKSIFMLREMVGLLQTNNDSITQEMGELAKMLMLEGGDIAAELKKQENNATLFKGELFDILRSIVKNYGTEEGNSPGIDFSKFSQPETPVQDGTAQSTGAQRGNGTAQSAGAQQGNAQSTEGAAPKDIFFTGEAIKSDVSAFLKALNGVLRNDDMLKSVANNLRFIQNSVAPSADLSGKAAELAKAFDSPEAFENLGTLKTQVIQFLSELGQSILYSDKLDKIASITIYNLSRINTNSDFLNDALSDLLQKLPTQEEREALFEKVSQFADNIESFYSSKQPSQTMNVLAKIIELQSKIGKEAPQLNEKFETVVHSLLSSPCNYTPLLHFVIPVEFMDTKAYAEMWVNPNEEEEMSGKTKMSDDYTHILAEFDIEKIGQMELELSVKGKTINGSLFCPKDYLEEFSAVFKGVSAAVAATGYKFDVFNVEAMNQPRSLIEVFKFLPFRRMGIDVKA